MVSWRRSGKNTSADPAASPPPGGAGAASPEPTAGGASGEPPREPTPARGEDVPGSVLDELRQAFTGTPPAGAETPVRPADARVPAAAGEIDLDELPPAEFDDLTGEPPRAEPAPRPTIRIGDELGPGVIAPSIRTGVTEGTGGTGSSPAATPWRPDPSGGLDATAALDTTEPLDDAEPWVLDPLDPFEPIDPLQPIDPIMSRASVGPGGGSLADPDVDPWVVATPDRASAAPASGTSSSARPTIVIGGDDDLPDAVYLDDDPGIAGRDRDPGDALAAGEAGERETIVIGDELEASGAFDAVAIPSRSMDPRVRARRIAVKRAQGRKRLIWVAGVGGVVLVAVAVLAVFSSSLFAVERVDVQGAPYTQDRYADRLQVVIDQLRGQPVLLVDTQAAEEALEALPWIERAFVNTDFPNRVLIDVRERQPLATFQGSDGRYRVIDRDGFVLDVLDGRPASYMLVAGVGPDIEAGSSAGSPYAAAAQLVGALPAEIRDITVSATLDASTIDLGLIIQRIPQDDPSDPAADPTAPATDGAMPTEPELVTVRIGSFNGLDGKLARLLQLVREGLDDASPIDVSTDDVIG